MARSGIQNLRRRSIKTSEFPPKDIIAVIPGFFQSSSFGLLNDTDFESLRK